MAAALLYDRDAAPDGPVELEVAQQHDSVAEVAEVKRHPHRSLKAMLGQDQDGQHPELVEVAQKLVHLENQEALFRHGIEVAVEAVNHDDAGAVHLDGMTD